MKYKRLREIANSLWAIILAGILVVGCNPESATQAPGKSANQKPAPSVAQESFQPQPQTKDQKDKTVGVYWLDATADTVQLISKPLLLESKNLKGDKEILEAAFQQLLAGPKDEAYISEIPEGTKLLDIAQRPEGIYINLSEEVEMGGGTMSMTGRLAQILYTATSLHSNTKVWLQVEGETREVFGGEGLILEQPLNRKSFEADFGL